MSCDVLAISRLFSIIYRIYSCISQKILYQIIAQKVGERLIHEVALKVLKFLKM